MAKDSSIFRKVALDRLSSPEQLDQLMQITAPQDWLMMAGVGILLTTTLAWGVLGTIPERISGQGILLRSGGVFEVISQSGGRISDLAVRVGDTIVEGRVIARLAQPHLAEEIQQARERAAELVEQQGDLEGRIARDLELQTSYSARRRVNLTRSIAASQLQFQALTDKVRTQEDLVRDGLLTRQALLTSRREVAQVAQGIRADSSALVEVDVQELQASTEAEERLRTGRARIAEARRELSLLENDARLQSEVVSPYTGIVLEMMVEQGGIVDRGEPILTVSLSGRSVQDLEAVVYIPSEHGKKIRPGMEIHLAPSTVEKEEFGFLLGRVTYVSDFPATPQGMTRVLKNTRLVTTLSGADAPYEVHADLIPDATSVSQYRWTSSGGPPTRIQSGTLAEAKIVVAERRPITMVVPQLRRRTDNESRAAPGRASPDGVGAR